jgi:hypothetical protein
MHNRHTHVSFLRADVDISVCLQSMQKTDSKGDSQFGTTITTALCEMTVGLITIPRLVVLVVEVIASLKCRTVRLHW